MNSEIVCESYDIPTNTTSHETFGAAVPTNFSIPLEIFGKNFTRSHETIQSETWPNLNGIYLYVAGTAALWSGGAVYLWIYYAQRAEATCVANYLRHFETIRNKHFDAWRRHARNSFGAMRAHAR